ncbi:Aste57867_22158 [Aphanomyces stellatus]|uniref:Aste57867_14778 protein n=1 Tax=Aphanomyces stellatus TaxID=120398 RepID=A0A485LJE8_9STRA
MQLRALALLLTGLSVVLSTPAFNNLPKCDKCCPYDAETRQCDCDRGCFVKVTTTAAPVTQPPVSPPKVSPTPPPASTPKVSPSGAPLTPRPPVVSPSVAPQPSSAKPRDCGRDRCGVCYPTEDGCKCPCSVANRA